MLLFITRGEQVQNLGRVLIDKAGYKGKRKGMVGTTSTIHCDREPRHGRRKRYSIVHARSAKRGHETVRRIARAGSANLLVNRAEVS